MIIDEKRDSGRRILIILIISAPIVSLVLRTSLSGPIIVWRASDDQVFALWIILQPLAWPAEEISPEEALEIAEAKAEIEAGKGIKAEDVWRELGT